MDYPVVIHVTLVVPTTFRAESDTDLEQRVNTFCDNVLPALKKTLHTMSDTHALVSAELFGQLVAQRQPQYEES